MNRARTRTALLMISDVAVLTAVFFGVHSGFDHCFYAGELNCQWNFLPGVVIYALLAAYTRLYCGNFFYPGLPLSKIEEMRRTFLAITVAALLMFVYTEIMLPYADHQLWVIATGWFFGFWLLLISRSLLRLLLKKLSICQTKVLIAGYGSTGQKIFRILHEDPYYGFDPVGFVDDAEIPGKAGKICDAATVAARNNCRILVCCLPLSTIEKHLNRFLRYFTHVSIAASSKVFPISWAYPVNIGGIPGLELTNQLRQKMPLYTKRIFEITMAVFCVLLLWPLLLILAVMVKLSSPGPIFYKARRLGRFGKTIEVWKFRTMYEDADKKLDELLAGNPELALEWRTHFKLNNDPRITPLGSFLRKTSLDELPQLFNVIRGEMAIIGPRPIVEAEKEYYGQAYEAMAMVKPGISGYWQISGRSDVSYERRVELDLFYIFNWSVWFDVYIMMMTVVEVLRCRGAK